MTFPSIFRFSSDSTSTVGNINSRDYEGRKGKTGNEINVGNTDMFSSLKIKIQRIMFNYIKNKKNKKIRGVFNLIVFHCCGLKLNISSLAKHVISKRNISNSLLTIL